MQTDEIKRGVAQIQAAVRQEVIVVDFNMPFMSMVGLMIKIGIASIPAAIILAAIFSCTLSLLGGTLVGVLSALLGNGG